MSGFLKNNKEYSSVFSSEIDFDAAELLDGSGSTCDIYRTKWQRHTVFVKRLKEELRSKPLYLDALDKEYEIGVRLKHESLPTYLHFHRDYLVMEYIDGKTLAELIRTKDEWLGKERNVRRLLKELVEVVGYLHRQGVVHCDIKPDNILITNDSRNLVLIDFDKCYTDSLDDTSGHPARFGLPLYSQGRTNLDFRGIAQVAKTIIKAYPNLKNSKFKRFIKDCYKPDINADGLWEALDKWTVSYHNRLVRIAALVLFLFIISTGLYLLYNFGNNNGKSVENVTALVEAPSDSTISTIETDNFKPPVKTPVVEITQEQLHSDAQKMAEVLDRRISPDFEELTAELNRLAMFKQDTTLTGEQLLDKVRAFAEKEEEYKIEAMAFLKETFPYVISERELRRALAHSKVLTTYNKLAIKELAELGHEIERRSPQVSE